MNNLLIEKIYLQWTPFPVSYPLKTWRRLGKDVLHKSSVRKWTWKKGWALWKPIWSEEQIWQKISIKHSRIPLVPIEVNSTCYSQLGLYKPLLNGIELHRIVEGCCTLPKIKSSPHRLFCWKRLVQHSRARCPSIRLICQTCSQKSTWGCVMGGGAIVFWKRLVEWTAFSGNEGTNCVRSQNCAWQTKCLYVI